MLVIAGPKKSLTRASFSERRSKAAIWENSNFDVLIVGRPVFYQRLLELRPY
jgi:hypothetical protein